MKQKFQIGDRVIVTVGPQKGWIGIVENTGRTGNIVNIGNGDAKIENKRITYRIKFDNDDKYLYTALSYQLAPYPLKKDEFEFFKVAREIIDKHMYGHFITNTGSWLEVSPEDFGMAIGFPGFYTVNGMTINNDGLVSNGERVIEFKPMTEAKAIETIDVTRNLINRLDLYNCDPQVREELAYRCMYTRGGISQALNTAYMGIRGEKHRIPFNDIFKVFGNYIEQEFEQLRSNYLHICKRDNYLLECDNEISGKCLIGIDENLKLMFCYYRKSTNKFYDGLHDGAKEVHPVAFFKHLNTADLVDLIIKESKY